MLHFHRTRRTKFNKKIYANKKATHLLEDEGERSVVSADASDGRLQREEARLLHGGRDLARKAAGVLQYTIKAHEGQTRDA